MTVGENRREYDFLPKNSEKNMLNVFKKYFFAWMLQMRANVRSVALQETQRMIGVGSVWTPKRPQTPFSRLLN